MIFHNPLLSHYSMKQSLLVLPDQAVDAIEAVGGGVAPDLPVTAGTVSVLSRG